MKAYLIRVHHADYEGDYMDLNCLQSFPPFFSQWGDCARRLSRLDSIMIISFSQFAINCIVHLDISMHHHIIMSPPTRLHPIATLLSRVAYKIGLSSVPFFTSSLGENWDDDEVGWPVKAGQIPNQP